MRLTYSQKIARNFSLICYVLLIPGLLALIYPALIIIGGFQRRNVEVISWSAVPFLIVAFGVALLIGYLKHSKGNLPQRYVLWLWIASGVYNFLLLLPWLFLSLEVFFSKRNFMQNGEILGFFIIIGAVLGYTAAVYYSLRAYFSESRIKLS